ncbi:MAG: helix-turn-helix transcriptional regulator [Pseudomonadota bacterium]
MDKRKEFGDWIRKKRNETGLSLWKVSKELGYKSRGTLACVECGQMSLPLERIFDLAELYGIDLDDILDKLGECEPELYDKFMGLRARFLKHLTIDLTNSLELAAGGRKMTGLHKQNYQDTGRRHHKPFLNEDGYIEVDHTIYYQTLLIHFLLLFFCFFTL